MGASIIYGMATLLEAIVIADDADEVLEPFESLPWVPREKNNSVLVTIYEE